MKKLTRQTFQSLPILLALTSQFLHQSASAQRASPVVGILTQPRGETTNSSNPGEYVIAASYVKWLEAGGARSIPIPYDSPPALVGDLYQQINGLLLPGGASEVPESVQYLLTLALQASESNDFFPVWGTCLGFEYIVQVISNCSSSDPILTTGFEAENISLPLANVDRRKGQLYSDPRIYDMVTTAPITMNMHHKGVDPGQFEKNRHLNQFFQVTSTNLDKRARPFVSTIEPRNPQSFPWYGVQYHPEKNSFEYGTYPGTNIPYEAINHSDHALEFANHLARFFVSLTRKQQQQHSSHHEYTKPGVYPLVNTYTMKRSMGFEEYYVVPPVKRRPTDTVIT